VRVIFAIRECSKVEPSTYNGRIESYMKYVAYLKPIIHSFEILAVFSDNLFVSVHV